jgi:hypothetical protein
VCWFFDFSSDEVFSTEGHVEVTAENNEKVNPLKAKMQWVSLPEDVLVIGQNILEKIQGC